MKIVNNFLLLPSSKVFVSDILSKLNKSNDDIEKTISTTGIESFHVSNTGLSSFILKGISAIKNTHDKVFENVDAVIVISQTYDYRIPSVSTRIQKELNLKSSTYCIDIMDGCAGFIKGLHLSQILQSQGFSKVMILAGDLNSKITSESDSGTKVIFGDGISVTILERSDIPSNSALRNDGDIEGTICCSFEENIMNMNGFEVFRFTRKVVPSLIEEYLQDMNKSIDDFDLIALHQASDLVVSTMCKSLKIKNKYINNFACNTIGNLGAGSIGAWLSNGSDLSLLGQLNMLAIGFGAGFSWGISSVIVDINLNEVIYV